MAHPERLPGANHKRRTVLTLTLLLPALCLACGEGVDEVPEILDITWEMGPSMPWPTKGQAQATIGDLILAAGAPGFPGWEPSSQRSTGKGWQIRDRGRHVSGWILDTRTQEYGLLPELPVGIKWPQGATVGEAFYVFTGWVIWPEEQNDNTSNRMFRLAGDRKQWEELPSLRVGRFLPGAAVSGTTIVVIGGQATFGAQPFMGDHPGAYVNSVEAFDTADPGAGWRDLPPLPGMGRESAATTAVGDDIYVFGGDYVNYAESRNGRFEGHLRHCADGYVLNLKTLRWRRLPDLPFPVHGMEAVAYRDRFIIMGGGIKDYPVDHPYRYKDRIPDVRSPNFDVLVFDTVEKNLPDPSLQNPSLSGPPRAGAADPGSHRHRPLERGLPAGGGTEPGRKEAVPLRRGGHQPPQRHRRGGNRNHRRVRSPGAATFLSPNGSGGFLAADWGVKGGRSPIRANLIA